MKMSGVSEDVNRTKAHYEVLDGLRGVAALLVVVFHVFEGFAISSGSSVIGGLNHGYLAVDFFFLLSGYVLAYAYDDRWSRGLTLRRFFLRRLIRLQPMMVMGAFVGLLVIFCQGCEMRSGEAMELPMVALAFVCALLMVPAWPRAGFELRGAGEMYPLNGPAWTLLFEYAGNVLYALVLRRLCSWVLGLLTLLLGAGLAWFAVADVSGYGFISVGWRADAPNLLGGSLRLLFPFCLGMWVCRCVAPGRVRGAFWICSAVLLVLFAVPFLPSWRGIHVNGVYEWVCIAVVFPVLVWLGASACGLGRGSMGVCRWLGRLSYPLYAVHYPLMYVFFQWLVDERVTGLSEGWPVALLVVLCSVLLAWLCLRFYDEPLRRWLGCRLLRRS